MRSNVFFLLVLAVSVVLGTVVPKQPEYPGPASSQAKTEVGVGAEEEFAELEARGFHASCIIAMTTCLASYGLGSFRYQETMIEDKYVHPWQLCGVAAVFSGVCQDGVGVVKPEPGQMFQWHKDNGLVQHLECSAYPCDDDDDCWQAGCDFCSFSVCREDPA